MTLTPEQKQAVSAWVSQVDEAAVRNSPAVDILLNRSDLKVAKRELAKAGFVYERLSGIDLFLDGPDAKPRDAVHVVFAGEKVRADDRFVAPEIHESVRINAHIESTQEFIGCDSFGRLGVGFRCLFVEGITTDPSPCLHVDTAPDV